MEQDADSLTSVAENNISNAPRADDTQSHCDDTHLTSTDAPPQSIASRLAKLIKSLAKDFVEHSKNAEQ